MGCGCEPINWTALAELGGFGLYIANDTEQAVLSGPLTLRDVTIGTYPPCAEVVIPVGATPFPAIWSVFPNKPGMVSYNMPGGDILKIEYIGVTAQDITPTIIPPKPNTSPNFSASVKPYQGVVLLHVLPYTAPSATG